MASVEFRPIGFSITWQDITFVDGGGGADSITTVDEDFVAAGFEAGDNIFITGTASPNDKQMTIVSLVAKTITLATGIVTARESGGVTLTLSGQNSLQNSDESYFTARNASEADTVIPVIKVGQGYDSTYYDVHRGVVCFDTSGLDNDCLIQSAILQLRIASQNLGLGTVMIKNGMPDHPEISAIVGDYDRTLYSGNGGTGTPFELDIIINLNSTGLDWINKNGNTKFLLMSLNDINGVAPDPGDEYAQMASDGEPRPKLTVVYTIPTGAPVVGDPTFSNTKSTYTTATANVSDDGGGYTERGFEYGLTETATWTESETGAFTGTGNFSLQVTGLEPNTLYYVRTRLDNDFGTGYSNWTSFTTASAFSYGIYEESNDPTICFYVRRAGGKWSIKHGPYTEDQADIEIGKILVEGKGKYQIKFTSDVLTGLSVNIMTKLDIRARS